MIQVTPAPEPECFDALVRRPGLQAIKDLIGDPTAAVRTGRPRKVVASAAEDIPADQFPAYWTRVHHELLDAYHRICAYACLHIPPVTGAGTVDHFAPKSRHWMHVYEWGNYRLACGIINAVKQAYEDVVVPFEVEEGMFALDLTALMAVAGPNAGARRDGVAATISRLRLDGPDYKAALGHYHMAYRARRISFAYLEQCAPFLAYELRRQGDLNDEDV